MCAYYFSTPDIHISTVKFLFTVSVVLVYITRVRCFISKPFSPLGRQPLNSPTSELQPRIEEHPALNSTMASKDSSGITQ